MKILIVNCDSSSLKHQLIDMEDKSVLAKGLYEKIGIDGSLLTRTPAGGEKYRIEAAMPSHKEVTELVMQVLIDPPYGVIKSTDEISAIGHRVVHGRTYYNESVLANKDVKKVIADCFDLAPFHNPANLVGIEVCGATMPGKPNVAVFDTAFDMSTPERVYLYALPYGYYEKYKVRRYGSYGINHDFVAGEVIRKSGLDPKSAKAVVYHLGNGASASASIGGRCVDTSMGPIPLEGLIMDIRSGDIDPTIIQSICEYGKLTVEEMIDILNKKSGVLGLDNGISSDFRDIDNAANGDNHLAKVALEAYTPRAIEHIGAYVAVMNGVDAVAFTTGVGENDKFMRRNICAYLGYLGTKIDDERNNVRGEGRLISADDLKVQVHLLPTNKEPAIARDTLRLTKQNRRGNVPRQGSSRNERKESLIYAFGTMINKLKGNPKTIVFTEDTDPCTLEVVSRLLAGNFLKPILVDNPAAIEAAAEDAGYNIRGAQTVDPENFDRSDEMVEMFCEIGKSKGATPEQAKEILSDANYFGTMLIKMGISDRLLDGTTYSTADTVRPALQIIKTKPGNKIASSCFILVHPSVTGDNELFTMADCAINIKPIGNELVEICGETVNHAKIFGIDPKVAFLSYSTVGPGPGEDVDKMRNVCAKAKAAFPNEAIDSEMQSDAAASPTVARIKIKDNKVAGYVNTLIFPDIDAGNTGYKTAQRLGGFDAHGPTLFGLNAPINGLSRGRNALGVYSMATVTAALA